MKSFLIKCSGVLAVALLALFFMFSGHFASIPAANAASLNGQSISLGRLLHHRPISGLVQPPAPTQNTAPLLTGTQSLVATSSIWAIDSLNPVTFNWIDSSGASSTQVGFIAQQVQTIFPELVSTTTSSTSPLTPSGTLGLISPIVSAIQALSSEVQSLVATVQGFANQFTTKQLCVENSDGTPVCITGDQLTSMLASAGQTPSNPVQISGWSFTIASSTLSSNDGTTTSTTTDTVIIAASSPPPTSPPDTSTASSTDATTSAATSTSQ